jgi:thiosulfate/3-mercaptopyruvate sulfurtransferase
LFDPETGLIRPPAELKAAFDAIGATSRERVITYCGGGIAATLDAFALTLLGHPNVAVYDGSLTEWMADESLPVQVG